MQALDPRGAAVVGWCGMRGTVTLAAALALPTGDAAAGIAPFPYRDLILVSAFGVVLGTLVLQGLTLRPLLLRLRLEDDGKVEREVRLARVETLRAAAALPRRAQAPSRHRYELLLRRAEAVFAETDPPTTELDPDKEATVDPPSSGTKGNEADAAIVLAATGARRRRLVALRADGTIGDAAFQRVEEELDWAELYWTRLLQTELSDGET